MKSHIYTLLLLGGTAAVMFFALPTPSQGQAGASDDAASALLINEIVAQQALISENQVKIEEKLAQVGEEVRQARLFVARGGGARR